MALNTTILFLAADPTDASRLRLGLEFREIQEKLQLGRLRERFRLEQRMSIRPVDISQALLDVQPEIVHFSGHGTATGELCFENQIGETHPVQPDALAALFEQFASQVKCVLLNACYSVTQADAIAKHIDYVIGMNKAVGDNAAIAFAIGFYQALGAGRSIDEAYKLGCVQIRLEGIPEHLTPILIKKGQENILEPSLQPGSQLTLNDASTIDNFPNNYHDSHVSSLVQPQLELKIIDKMGQHLDEIAFTQTSNNQGFDFGLALLNTAEGSDPAEKIDIRVQCSWDGNNITSAPKFNTGKYGGATAPVWQVHKPLIQQGIQPYPAVLTFHGAGNDRCAYGHPLEWDIFVVTVAQRMVGRFILDYTISSANPKGEYRGQLKIVMNR
jgi:hypothetical protein